MDLAQRKKYYNLCDPFQPVGPEDPRNVNFDQPENGEFVRGQDWVGEMAMKIVMSDIPRCRLFTGLIGSGKSTELRRLAGKLEEDGFLCALIDAEELINLSTPIDVIDVLVAVLYGAERAVLRDELRDRTRRDPEIETLNRKVADKLNHGFLKRFFAWVSDIQVDLKKLEIAAKPGKLVFEMRDQPSLRNRIRDIVTSRFSHFFKDAREEMAKISDRAKSLGHNGLVVILDSLEKLRGISTNWPEVLISAEQVFGGSAPYLRLPVHTIYMVPPALAHRINDIDFMPMIKVKERDGKPNEQGIRAAIKLVVKRVPETALCQILGPEWEKPLRQLIDWTGGYPREILELMQNVIIHPQYPVPVAHIERLIARLKNDYRTLVPSDAFSWLAELAASHFLTDTNARRETADNMLANHTVLRYQNGDLWFDLHPAVRVIPGVAEAIKELNKGPSNEGAK